SSGVVHPIITVTINRPIPAPSSNQILELPDASGLPEHTSILLSLPQTPDSRGAARAAVYETDQAEAGGNDEEKSAAPRLILSTGSGSAAAQPACSECTGSDIKIETRTAND
ncbi:hypothetical protein LPJ75_007356, partial [Coemansia sp. RSA 2598]